MGNRAFVILIGFGVLLGLWIRFLPINYYMAFDYCANWYGPGSSICTPFHLKQQAIELDMDICKIGYAGPYPSSIECRDYFPPGRNPRAERPGYGE